MSVRLLQGMDMSGEKLPHIPDPRLRRSDKTATDGL